VKQPASHHGSHRLPQPRPQQLLQLVTPLPKDEIIGAGCWAGPAAMVKQ
jgi:hypothetical protein